MLKWFISVTNIWLVLLLHHWSRTNLWKGASKIKQYKVTSKLGKNATTAKRKSAVA